MKVTVTTLYFLCIVHTLRNLNTAFFAPLSSVEALFLFLLSHSTVNIQERSMGRLVDCYIDTFASRFSEHSKHRFRIYVYRHNVMNHNASNG